MTFVHATLCRTIELAGLQGCENTAESRSHLAMLRAMYDETCGYRSETGGIMENLRTSTNNKKVRDYHRDFYRPENLCLIITGRIDPQKVFASMEGFLGKLKQKEKVSRPLTRPWLSPIAALDKNKDVEAGVDKVLFAVFRSGAPL